MKKEYMIIAVLLISIGIVLSAIVVVNAIDKAYDRGYEAGRLDECTRGYYDSLMDIYWKGYREGYENGYAWGYDKGIETEEDE